MKNTKNNLERINKPGATLCAESQVLTYQPPLFIKSFRAVNIKRRQFPLFLSCRAIRKNIYCSMSLLARTQKTIVKSIFKDSKISTEGTLRRDKAHYNLTTPTNGKSCGLLLS